MKVPIIFIKLESSDLNKDIFEINNLPHPHTKVENLTNVVILFNFKIAKNIAILSLVGPINFNVCIVD